MSWLWNGLSHLAGLVFSRQLWVFLGLLALALLIWVAGPLLALGSLRPLEAEWARWLLIGLMFAVWAVRLAYRSWRAAQLNAQLLQQLRTPARSAGTPAEPEDPQLAELRGHFDRASQMLEKLRFGPAEAPDAGSGVLAPVRRWLARLNRHYLYQLPWYIFIGAPGSGKTTALVNSGLNFPLADQFGKAAIRGIGGTRNCDWWFTNEAVLIDTAGRYTTQESHQAQDQREWSGFLSLLKRYRGKQPINGALLTVSVEDLVRASDSERARHAMVLRKRLYELREQLGIAFPVYLLVTKADLLAGFTEYFGRLDREERAQVWGFTLPLAPMLQGELDLSAAFDTHYAQLLRRLNDGLPELLAAEPDAARRQLIYLMPQQFATLQSALGEFVAAVFSDSRFEARPLLRGVYLTSGTQEGTVFDRVMGGLQRALQIEATPAARSLEQGRSFFLRRLMQDVVFSESGLAGLNAAWQRRRRLWRQAALVAVAVLFAGSALLWSRSYWRNGDYLAQVQAKLTPLDQRVRAVKVRDDGDLLRLLPVMQALRELPATPAFDVAHPPMGVQFGLYQGDKIAAASDAAYQRSLEDALLPLAVRRIERVLRTAADDAEYSYEGLKAYLMLYDTAHYDAEFMQAFVGFELKKELPAAMTRDERDAVWAHIGALFGSRVVSSPYPMDEALVAQTRERLVKLGLAQRAYGRLKRSLLRQTEVEDFDLVRTAGPQSSLVFRRVSGKSLNDGVPGLFTYKGYWSLFKNQSAGATEALAAEDTWVLNLKSAAEPTAADREAWQRELRRLYFNDYVQAWDGFLADLRLQSATSLTQSIQVVRTLSAADSPLVRVMNAASRETTLLRDAKDDERTLIDQARDKVSSARQSIEKLLGTGPDTRAARGGHADRQELLVDEHFTLLRQMTEGGANGNAPIQGVVALLNDLYNHLSATEVALRSGNAPPAPDALLRLRAEAARLPSPFREMLGELATAADGKVASAGRQVLGQTASGTIGQFCRQAIGGRYPFTRGSPRDTAPGDFALLFAPGGMMDDFFQKSLQPQVDMSGAVWRFKAGMDGRAAGPSPLLASFQNAAVIRDTFFGTGLRSMAFRIDMKPLQMDPSITQLTLDVDGQLLRYAHGPQAAVSLQWPGPRGGSQVRVQALLQDGQSTGWVTEGPWALLRLFDRAVVSAGRSADEMVVSFDLGGRRAQFEVHAHSVRNPLRLPQLAGFSCPEGGA